MSVRSVGIRAKNNLEQESSNLITGRLLKDLEKCPRNASKV